MALHQNAACTRALGRKALWAQLQAALEGEPDPWFEFDKAAVDSRQFVALGVPA